MSPNGYSDAPSTYICKQWTTRDIVHFEVSAVHKSYFDYSVYNLYDKRVKLAVGNTNERKGILHKMIRIGFKY